MSPSQKLHQKQHLAADASDAIGGEMHWLITTLYPICRSITGNGLRETLRVLREHVPIEIHEVPSGTKVFDWTVPKEWNIRDAFIKNARGEKIVDFARSNLHVMSYSTPFSGKVPLQELKKHLFTLPDHPDWIPYRTSYYKENWGFCLTSRQLSEMTEGEYEVLIDSSFLEKGSLTYGEYYLRGDSTEEVLISCHICHPSLCNDNLSGIALAVFLAKHIRLNRRRYSYRFLFIPGTIGSITWLALNESKVSAIKHGLVLAGVGDKGPLTYKKTRPGFEEVDRVFEHILTKSPNGRVIDFHPYGYDERQFCSPGFNLPVGCVMRTPFGEYPEYHTSADDLNFVSPEELSDSFAKCAAALGILESNRIYVNQNPKCEPQLGKRGLYESGGGQNHRQIDQMSLLWVLNLSDGSHSLLDIARRSGQSFTTVKGAADLLVEHGLLKEVSPLES